MPPFLGHRTSRVAPGSPRLFGISVIRNEGDIVGQALRHAAPMHDLILVADACSSDDTVAEIRKVEAESPHIVFLGTLPHPAYAEQVRRHIWSHLRKVVPKETWWSLVDGDEFAHEDLRQSLVEAYEEGADHIQGAFATFFFTERDAQGWEEGRETIEDRSRPIEERRLIYDMRVYSTRLFRHSSDLRWNEDTAIPDGLLRPLRRRAHYRHYQYRDPPQIELRFQTRTGIDLPERFRKIHFHWAYSPEQAVFPEDRPEFRRHTPGAPLIPDPRLEKPWVKGPIRRLPDLWKARTLARTPQGDSIFTWDLSPEEILARMRRD